MKFRPCIDLRDGKVVQIVGSTLNASSGTLVNFESDRGADYFATLFARDGLAGGHVIALGQGNHAAAIAALAAYPGGLHYGGGVTPANARIFLEAGASHVIATSYLFEDAVFSWSRLRALAKVVGRERLVVDLSCMRVQDDYVVMTNRWRDRTDLRIEAKTLAAIAEHCSEFLVHATEVEGKQGGIEERLVECLAHCAPLPTTYAGGVRSLLDLQRIRHLGQSRIDVTVGSALDLYGGTLPLVDVVSWFRELAV